MEQLRENLRKLRKIKGWAQEDLAQEVDVLKKIGELPLEEFDQVRTAYEAFEKARAEIVRADIERMR